MKPKRLKILFLAFAAWLVFFGAVEAQELEQKYSVEISYEANNNVLKIRPFDYTYLSQTQRTDVLVGRRFRHGNWTFTGYAYFKCDNKDRNWIGSRVDYGTKFLNGRLSTRLELRYFIGLNDKSSNHFYVIPTIYYQFDKKGILTSGLGGYGQKAVGGDPFFYVGPDVIIKLTKNLSALLSYSVDVYGGGGMTWLVFYFYL